MRSVLITLAAVAIFGLTNRSAVAGHPHGWQGGYAGYQGYSQHGAGCCCGCQQRSSYYSPSLRYSPYGPYLGMTHEESVRRIMAEHSRDRYYTHPRSMYNEPPRYGYGYSRW
jgi:hypothetical protein